MAGHSVIWHMEDSSKTREVLPLTQKYQTEQKDFHSKMPDRRLHVYSAQIIFLQLNQVTLQPEFNLNNVTCIYTTICSIMFYYFGGDLTLNRPGGGAESAHRLVLPSAVLKR